MVGYAIRFKMMKKLEWLELLLKSKFFGSCLDHRDLRKNDVNVFCIDCNQRLCQHCLASSDHHLHKQLQIRRYVYQDVVRLQDIQKYLDCSKVQPYQINGAKVLFLNPRPQLKQSKTNSGACCEVCERNLSDSNRYCSIACKISEDKGRDRSPSISFPVPELSDDEKGESEQDNPNLKLKEEEAVIESTEKGDHNLFASALKPRRRLNKRKGIPRRAALH